MKNFIADSDILIKNLKNSITKLRKENGLYKRDVAKALNMNENTYRMWEDSNRSCPKIYDIYRISRLYGVSVDNLLANDDGNNEPSSFSLNDDSYNRKSDTDYLSSLDRYEKLLIMNARMLSPEKKNKLNDFLYNLVNE